MAHLFHSALDAVAAAVEAINPEIGYTPVDDAGGVDTFWYTTPHQHVVEFVLVNLCLLPFIYYMSTREWVVVVPARVSNASSADVWTNKVQDSSLTQKLATAKATPTWLTVLDYALRAQCLFNAVATIGYKAATSRWVYLFQPCHLSNYALIYLCFNQSKTASKVFYL